MAQNVSLYSLEPVLPNVIDNNLPPALSNMNATRADCLAKCYWSLVCATLFYDESTGDCYVSNRLYTLIKNHPKLTAKNGVTGYQWTTADCPSGKWSFHKPTGYCLMYKGTTLMSISNAQMNCISEGGRLVNIMTYAQNVVIGLVAGDSSRNEIWIGLNAGTGKWHLGDPVAYTAWENTPPSSGCTAMESARGLWRGQSCTLGRMYICEKYTQDPCALP